MDASAHDLLFVGGGAAGLRTAIAAADLNPKLSIAIVFKVTPCTATLFPPKAAQPVCSTDDSMDEHAQDTISSREWLWDRDAIQASVKETLCSCNTSIVIAPGVVSRMGTSLYVPVESKTTTPRVKQEKEQSPRKGMP